MNNMKSKIIKNSIDKITCGFVSYSILLIFFTNNVHIIWFFFHFIFLHCSAGKTYSGEGGGGWEYELHIKITYAHVPSQMFIGMRNAKV